MKKTFFLFLAGFITGISALYASEQAVIEYYVSATHGDDRNKGSKEAPFATPEQAAYFLRDNKETIIYLEENVTFDIGSIYLGENKKVQFIGKNTLFLAHARAGNAGGAGNRIIRAGANCEVKVKGITYQHGRVIGYITGGAIVFDGNKLEVDSCVFLKNEGNSGGAAIGCNAGEVIITHSYFKDNYTVGGAARGGVITQSGPQSGAAGSLIVRNCTFEDNVMNGWKPKGIAIAIWDNTLEKEYSNVNYLEVSNCTFINNKLKEVWPESVISAEGSQDQAVESAVLDLEVNIVNNTFYNNNAFAGELTLRPVRFINNIMIGGTPLAFARTVEEGRLPVTAYSNIICGTNTKKEPLGNVSEPCLTTDKATFGNVVGKVADYPLENLGLATALDKEQNFVPFLPVLSGESPLVNTGKETFEVNGKNIIPDRDIRGAAIEGQKDIGAYEYLTPNSIESPKNNDQTSWFAVYQEAGSVRIQNKSGKNGTIGFYSITGQKVYEKILDNELIINTSGWAPGIYVIRGNNGVQAGMFKRIIR